MLIALCFLQDSCDHIRQSCFAGPEITTAASVVGPWKYESALNFFMIYQGIDSWPGPILINWLGPETYICKTKCHGLLEHGLSLVRCQAITYTTANLSLVKFLFNWNSGKNMLSVKQIWLWPSDTVWRQNVWSTLAQVMAGGLTTSIQYLSQCWLFFTSDQ